MASITAIIVNWNAPQLTSRAVRSLLATTGEPDFVVCIVDNGSDDNSVAALRRDWDRHPRVRILPLPQNLGFGGGANAGIRASDSQFVALLNNDATPRPGWLDALAARLRANDHLGAVTSHIVLEGRWRELPPDEARSRAAAGDKVLRDGAGRAVIRDDEHGDELTNSTGNLLDASGNGHDRDWLRPTADTTASTPEEVSGFCGGAAMLRRAALDEVGLFDERLFMYYEDTDLSFRLRRAGWGIAFVPDAVVDHAHAASSSGQSARATLWNARNRLVIARRYGGWGMTIRAWARTLARWVRTAAAPSRRAEHRAVGRAMRQAIRLPKGPSVD